MTFSSGLCFSSSSHMESSKTQIYSREDAPHQLQVKPQAGAFLSVGLNEVRVAEIKPWAPVYDISDRLC